MNEDLPHAEREDELASALSERILVFDGAMGTAIQNLDLAPTAFGGPQFEGCNEQLVLTQPRAIRKIHDEYLEAGADIVETNTFGGIRHVLGEYGLQDKTLEINRAAAKIAVEAARKYSTEQRPRFAAGALGPGTKTISVTGGITFDEVRRNYAEAARGLLEGGVDLLVLETQQDTLNIKASLLGFQDAFSKVGRKAPVILAVSIETMGTMLGGQTAEALYRSIEHFDLFSIGLNCATGPDFMTDHLRTISSLSRFPVVCYPNAGLPDEDGRYNESPEMVARKLQRFAEYGWLNIVGGCCGTTPEHIREIANAVEKRPRREEIRARSSAVSGLEALTIDDDKRPILVGERTNVIGSKKFKNLIIAGEFEQGAEIGRKQIRGGAQIIDVCLANPDRDEKADMILFLDILTKKIKAPLMIDSTDPAVIEEALKRSPGKAIINSINLEDGEERFAEIVPLAKRYGAALVVGTIDEDKEAGMGVTRERKLEIARRSFILLTGEFGFPGEDIIFDPLTFPCATGDKNYFGSAEETIEGIRAIKKEMPAAKTILGVSNVSFGLPPAGREVLNAVFLRHCVEAGLDLAIVNAQKLARFATISDEEKGLADSLLFYRGPGAPGAEKGGDPIASFAAHFRKAAPKAEPAAAESKRNDLPVRERIARNVVEGLKEGLTADLDVLRIEEGLRPLEIVNGPLMKGMDEVGRLFAANEMIVAEVLQSAEVMKAAVSHLESFMDHKDMSTKGKVLLATVKGDVHDIGKNLVHIIFKNNGFAVTDLGIKVAPESLISAVREHSPDMIGLSGLLVKSAQQMAATAENLKVAGIKTPMLIGGAALSPRFAATRIAPRYGGPVFYAKDAMSGLSLANQLADDDRRKSLIDKSKKERLEAAPELQSKKASVKTGAAPRPAALRYDHNIPSPPDLKTHVLDDFDIEEIFKYINPVMLYGRHLGLKGRPEELLKTGEKKAVDLYDKVRRLQDEVIENKLIRPRAVIRFLRAAGEGDSLALFSGHSGGEPIETFDFPRQPDGDRLCLADFALSREDSGADFVALFAVTCGAGVRELSERWREGGEYFKSHALQALAIESAEAFAELLHEKIRSMWGIPDPVGMTIKQKFQARYRGIRVSPGYPACPALELQTKMWRLLEPEKNIQVTLTEGYMMDPEASVSALVFHHPQARYFSVNEPAVAR